MSDSGSSSIASGPDNGMLPRRVSNNRADLNGDQQMNHLLRWFNDWSELQKADFVPVLASRMKAGKEGLINGDVADGIKAMDTNSDRPPSLFSCQVKLFRDWFGGWSDDQKNYLTLRLKDVDEEFFAKYEVYLQNPHPEKKKDYFEPGVPDHLVRHSNRSMNNGDNGDEDGDDLKKPTPPAAAPVTTSDIAETTPPSEGLSTISE